MTIALTPDQIAWLEGQVATGVYASVDDAVRLAVAGLMAAEEADDLDWARPLVDDAKAAVEAGQGVAAANVKAEMDGYLKSIGAR